MPDYTPTLADAVISEINTGLTNHFTWLDRAFGRAERIVKKIDGFTYKLPAYFVGDSVHPNDYIELSPDSNIGNFSFFWMMDPERYTWRPKIRGSFRSPFALIVWFDLRKVYNSTYKRDLSSIEAEILNVLNGGFQIKSGRIEIDTVYRLPENIYREFTLDAVDNQFLMHPYAGFRFEGELIFEEPCLTTT